MEEAVNRFVSNQLLHVQQFPDNYVGYFEDGNLREFRQKRQPLVGRGKGFHDIVDLETCP
jgi:hypothetical protein